MKGFIVIILSILILQSCGFGERQTTRRYILENGTERKVKLELYRAGNLRSIDSISGKGIIKQAIRSDDGGRYQLLAIFAFNQPDSAVVTFDDEKFLKYIFRGPTDVDPAHQINILSDSAYVVESHELYRYTFTEEDYEKAELIEE